MKIHTKMSERKAGKKDPPAKDKKTRGIDFHPDEDNHLKKVIVEKCFRNGLPKILHREDHKGIERQISDWSEDLKLPSFKERTEDSWKARFRKKKYEIFNIDKKPVDGRIARGQQKKD